MKRFIASGFLGVFLAICVAQGVFADTSILSPEESLWLKNRNNTIVVYPEKNYPPFSYQNTASTPQGLSIDYIELIAEKIGAHVTYLPARARSQVLDDIQNGKGDIATSLSESKDTGDTLLFTDSYISIPAVIVVRKDFPKSATQTLNDFSGMKIAVGEGYAVEDFVRKNYSRVILEHVTDDEIGLQQVVLGEVDGAVMDVATLSFYLSKQALNSVKIVGNTGFEYKLAFAVPKNKAILQSILDKGLSQVSVAERQVFSDKWVSFVRTDDDKSFVAQIQDNLGTPVLSVLIILGFAAIIFALGRRYGIPYRHHSHRSHMIDSLEEKIEELHESEAVLSEEMTEIKTLEKSIESKIQNLNKE